MVSIRNTFKFKATDTAPQEKRYKMPSLLSSFRNIYTVGVVLPRYLRRKVIIFIQNISQTI